MKEQRRMYKDLAWIWPIISPKEDYVQEAEAFYRVINENSFIEVDEILHLGCGGGLIDYTLKNYARLTGLDLSEEMLTIAKRLNPEVEYLVGDMRTARLGRLFDGVFIADSIDYMLSENELRQAFETAFLHLRPGGIFCIYAETTPDRFEQNASFGSSHHQDELEIAFFENLYDPDPQDTTYEMTFVYLIRRDGQLTIETDRHLGGIFPIETWLRLLSETGFEVQQAEFGEEKNPLFICRK